MNTIYRQTYYKTSAFKISQLPPDKGIEIAIAGRSNAGKSSAINAIADHKSLAKVSKTPGRTQMINFFEVAADKYIVDLPGYGYAKVPLKLKQHWVRTLESYLAARQSLRGLFVVMDIRHPLSQHDWQIINWAHQYNIALHILLTKADKLSKSKALNSLYKVEKELTTAAIGASLQLFSALKKQGISDAHQTLDQWFEL